MLLYYSTPERGAELLQRLARASWEITARPATRLQDAWSEGSDVDLVLLDPPQEDERWLGVCEELRRHASSVRSLIIDESISALNNPVPPKLSDALRRRPPLLERLIMTSDRRGFYDRKLFSTRCVLQNGG